MNQLRCASVEDQEADHKAHPEKAKRSQELRYRLIAKSITKQRQQRHQQSMFARAAAGITKHPQIVKVTEPTRRPRERKAAPAQRTSSSSSTSSQDPGDSDEPPAPGFSWAHPAWGWSS
jgi:hypothetical protein